MHAMDTVHENPVVETEDDSSRQVQVELQPLLGDGPVPREDFNALLIEVRSLRRELIDAERGGVLDSTVKRIYGTLTEAPTNWHQATVFFLCDHTPRNDGWWLRARGPVMFAISCVLVVLQTFTALALAVSIVFPPCESSDMCGPGAFCALHMNDRCQYCGSNAPLVMQTDESTASSYNFMWDDRFVGFNASYVADFCHNPSIGSCRNICADPTTDVGDIDERPCGYYCWDSERKLEDAKKFVTRSTATGSTFLSSDARYRLAYPLSADDVTQGDIIMGFYSTGEWGLVFGPAQISQWCAHCVLHDGDVDPTSRAGTFHDHVSSMSTLEWAALLFASIIVALTIVGELKDIELCTIATEHNKDALHTGWHIGLAALSFFRRWIFLSALSVSVPMLVLYRGGDTLSICFNSVAVLFMCEVDNIAYTLGLSERIRARVEDAARITLTDDQAALIARMKLVHTGLVSSGCMFTVYVAGVTDRREVNQAFEWALMILPCAFWAGAVIEVIGRGQLGPQLVVEVLKITGARVLSFPVAGAIILALFFPLIYD